MLGPAFVASIAYVDPGQLRHQRAGRRGVRLPAAVGGAGGEPGRDGDPVPLSEARDRHRPQLSRSSSASTSRARSRWGMWVQAEIMAMSTDIAEFIGAAIGLNLLFGVPLFLAGLMTGVIAFGILGLQALGFRKLRARDQRPARDHLRRLPLRDAADRALRARLAARPDPQHPRHQLSVHRGRDRRRDRDAARDLPALGADQGPDADPQRRREEARAALRTTRRVHRARARRPGQPGDARRRRQALPHPRPLGPEHDPAGPRPARTPRRRHRRARVRRRAARLRRLLLERRHLRRPGRDGRLHQLPDPPRAAPRDHDDPRARRARRSD